MYCVAVCEDVAGSGAARVGLLQAHAAHNFGHMGRFLLTGPTADSDGASMAGDDPRLRGSIYCLDIDSLAAARAVMETDPFMGKVWRSIDYHEWIEPSGAWIDGDSRINGLSPAFRCYLAMFARSLNTEGALASGALKALASTSAAAAPLGSIAFVRAGSMTEAASRAVGASRIMAVPIAIGRWASIESPADIPPGIR